MGQFQQPPRQGVFGPGVNQGLEIPPLTTKDLLSKTGKLDKMRRGINGWNKASINPPTAGRVLISPDNVIIDLQALVNSGGGGSGSQYRELYDPTTTQYNFGDIVYTGSTPSLRYFYICEVSNGTGVGAGAQTPDPTETASPLYWRLIAQPPGLALCRFQITTLSNADYIGCSQWNGSIFTGAVNIAKPELLRPSLSSEVIDGVTITYSSYTSDNARTASDGTNTEAELIYPRYRVNDIIYATPVQLNATGVGSVSWLEIKPARVWCRSVYP